LVVLLSLSRADVALLMALLYGLNCGAHFAVKAGVAAIPVLTQLWLSSFAFPESEYPVAVIRLGWNLRGSMQHLPIALLIAGAVVLWWGPLVGKVTDLVRHHRWSLGLLFGYCLSTWVVAQPNEYRLYIPLVPVVLFLVSSLPARGVEP
jgi:hypothetical protein